MQGRHLKFPGKYLFLIFAVCLFTGCSYFVPKRPNLVKSTTFAGLSTDKVKRFGEPFGIAVDGAGVVYVSDGVRGAIFRVRDNENIETVTDKLDTPSGITFDKDGSLIVVDSGSHTIKRINIKNSEVSLVAGVENKSGFADGDAAQALFNAPIGVAVYGDGKIYVADTYNDRIRVIENGKVSTLAGGSQGYWDSQNGSEANFNTPCGIAIWKDGSLLVADTGNRRIRRVEQDGKTITLAGNGEQNWRDGLQFESSFVQPTALTVDLFGAIYIADGNSIRVLGNRAITYVETISNDRRGFSDGDAKKARFNRPSGLAFDSKGNLLVTDADNRLIRALGENPLGVEAKIEDVRNLQLSAEEFRTVQPGRWPYDPPDKRRDIAGTLGEIRGEIKDGEEAWFHNGLDIAGGYGETARFVRSEKVLHPLAVENFGGLRELVRMPTMGYIHIRLGRDQNDRLFADPRFQFAFDSTYKPIGLRIPRGTRFEAGEAIGTLNTMNHVHLIAGAPGYEMNALAGLELPGYSDTVAPVIEEVRVFDQNWQPIAETKSHDKRIKISGNTRVVVTAFDRTDGNSERRRLSVYRLGYAILRDAKAAQPEPKWNIEFDRMPEHELVRSVYAPGSKSGYTPETVLSYIVTNQVGDSVAKEGFMDTANYESGNYILRVFASDFAGNITTSDMDIEIVK